MSMSTKIDDLPGPIPDDIKNDINTLQNSIDSPRLQPTQFNQQQTDDHIKYEQIAPISNISYDLKKKESKENKTFLEKLLHNFKNIFNEDNIVLLCLFILASISYIDKYLTKIPIIGNYSSNELISSIIKGVLLLLIYNIIKTLL